MVLGNDLHGFLNKLMALFFRALARDAKASPGARGLFLKRLDGCQPVVRIKSSFEMWKEEKDFSRLDLQDGIQRG